MPHLDVYQQLEIAAMSLDDLKLDDLAENVREILDVIWDNHLTSADIDFLNSRGTVAEKTKTIRESFDRQPTVQDVENASDAMKQMGFDTAILNREKARRLQELRNQGKAPE